MADEVVRKYVQVRGKDRDKLAKELIKKYKKGASIRELAEEQGKSYGFVHRLLSDAGVELRPRGGARVKASA